MSKERLGAAKPYRPRDVEGKIYRRWERSGVFAPTARPRRGRRVFSIVIPLPNVTGSLHMGHALNGTLQDVLVRYHRMQGDATVWVPGTDHAGIATQNVVERELREKEGKTRHDLGAQKFVERVWAWKEQYGKTIQEQLRRLGSSCDWSKERFTMDQGYARAVQEAFLHYAHRGLIYQGERIVNWCPRCASAISDLEVERVERDDRLYVVRYPRASGGDAVLVATTRPETMLGDVALAVHPSDARYASLVGAEVVLPLVGRRIPVLADPAVDPSFGSGVLKVTPAHDMTDAEIGERHRLPVVQVIGPDGTMTAEAGRFAGLTVQKAREAVLTALKTQKLLVREEPLRHVRAVCSRCETPIEPLVSTQWFLKMKPLAGPAMDAVKNGLITFHPPRWKRAYLEWLGGVRDWCISRQLWWGHRLPVWYCQTGSQRTGVQDEKRTRDSRAGTLERSRADAHIVFSIAKPKSCPRCGGTDFVQDPDVLDTWFSSALWPFAVFGWPEATLNLRRFYPTSVLVTARDILFLWVARMVFSGLEFMNRRTYLPARQYGKTNPRQQIPFRHVIIHPTVLTLQGRRMSKSLGTGVDPLDLIARYGADATRFGLLVQTQTDQQALRFDEQAVRAGRNAVNKLWNIARFAQKAWGQGAARTSRRLSRRRSSRGPTPFDCWILARFARATKAVTADIEAYRLGDATRTLHAFFWDEFADWYVEASKVPGATTPDVAGEVFQRLLRLAHPFLPFVTEALWAQAGGEGLLVTAPWPVVSPLMARAERSSAMLARVEDVRHIVRAVRSARAILGIPAARPLNLQISDRGVPAPLFPLIASFAGCQDVTRGRGGDAWVSLPRRGRAGMWLNRASLAGVDLPRRVAEAERQLASLRERAREEQRRLAVMKKGAPRGVLAEAEKRRAALAKECAFSEAAVAALKRMTASDPLP